MDIHRNVLGVANVVRDHSPTHTRTAVARARTYRVVHQSENVIAQVLQHAGQARGQTLCDG